MYRQLSYEERVAIATLVKEGLSGAAIARRPGRSQSTVSRELRRNKGGRGYRPQQAQGKARERRRKASSVPRKLTAAPRELIVSKLRLHWSPERIAGWLALKRIARISFQWICACIRADRKAGGHLYLHLRRQGRKPKRRPQAGAAGRGRIPGRVDISERPAVVDGKSRAGDWEVDTVIGAGHQGVPVTSVERKSKFAVLHAVPRKAEGLVGGAPVAMLEPLADLVLTVAADNGKEFAGHREAAGALGADMRFARPYRS